MPSGLKNLDKTEFCKLILSYFFGILTKNKKKICEKCDLHFKMETVTIHVSNGWRKLSNLNVRIHFTGISCSKDSI